MEEHHSVLEQTNAIKKRMKRVEEHENELNTCVCLEHSSSIRGYFSASFSHISSVIFSGFGFFSGHRFF